MRRPSRVRPSLMTLECRWLPASMPYPDPIRNAMATAYASQAQLATNPVVLLGDSITYNWGTTDRTAPGSTVFASTLAALGTANFGISGDTTSNLLGRVETGELAGKPKVAVVMIGVNDLIGGATPTSTASGISAVVQTIRTESPGTQVLLLSILPTDITAIDGKIAQVDSMIASLARSPNVTYLDLQQDFVGANGIARPSLLRDLVHPDQQGYDVIASAIDTTIDHLMNPVSVSPDPSPLASSASHSPSTTVISSTSVALIPIIIVPSGSGSSDSSTTETTTHHKSTTNDFETVRIN